MRHKHRLSMDREAASVDRLGVDRRVILELGQQNIRQETQSMATQVVSGRMAEYLERMASAKALKDAGRVKEIKAGKSGADLSMRPDLLERAEFEPDNSRIGRQSQGLQSGKLASTALWLGQYDLAARLMVQEHHDLEHYGLAQIVPFVSVTLLAEHKAQREPIKSAMPALTETSTTMLGTAVYVPWQDCKPVRKAQSKAHRAGGMEA